MSDRVSGSHTQNEEGKRLPGHLVRPYRSTYRHKYTKTTYVQTDQPNGSNWISEAEFFASGVEEVIGGIDIDVDNTDPTKPIVNWVGVIPPSGIQDIDAGPFITIDKTNPAIPIISSQDTFTEVNKTIYVDDKYGDDSTGVKELPSFPFKTIEAAEAVAVSGETILVRPGTYALSMELGKNGVIYKGENECFLTSNDPIFRDLSGSMSIKVYNFNLIANSSNAIFSTNAGSDLSFYNCKIESNILPIEFQFGKLNLVGCSVKTTSAVAINIESATEVILKQTTLESATTSITNISAGSVISIYSAANKDVDVNTTVTGTGLIVDPDIK